MTNDKLAETMHARDFGVKADGLTNDAAGMQNAINAAIKAGAQLKLPPGTINLGTTSLILNYPTNAAVSTGVIMEGDVGQSGAVANTTFLYSGSGSALRMISSTIFPTPQPCDGVHGFFVYTGRLSRFIVQQKTNTANNMDSLLEIRCGSEMAVQDVDLFVDGSGLHTANNGILCDACNTGVHFDRISISSQVPTSGIYAGQNTLINGFNFIATPGPGVFSQSGISVRDSQIGGQNIFRFNGGGAAFHISNIWNESSDTAFFFDDTDNGFLIADFFADGLHLVWNQFMPSHNVIKIMNVNNQTYNGILNFWLRNSDASLLSTTAARHVVPAAQCARSKNLVTCTCSSRSQCPSSSPSSGGGPTQNLDCRVNNCFPSKGKVQVYKTSAAADSQCPNGLKIITGSTATTFSYTETGPNGACGQVSTFDYSAYPIRYITNNASRNNQSQIDIHIERSHFGGWRDGVFQAVSLDTQVTSSSNWVNVRLVDNTAAGFAAGAPPVRNFWPFNSNLAVNGDTPSSMQEINLSNSPANLTNFSVSSEHNKACYHVTIGGGGTVTFSTHDSQNVCSCTGRTGSTASTCTATVAAGTALAYRSITSGKVTVTGTANHLAEVCCY